MKEPVFGVGRGKSVVASQQYELDELVAVGDSIASKPMLNSNCGERQRNLVERFFLILIADYFE